MEFASDVLLVADDSSLSKTVNFMLSDHLKSPVVTVAGATAMQEVVRCNPRIVFVQDDLRGGDGIQLGREVLKTRPSTVVLIARNELRAVDAYAAGIPDFLLTPLQRDRLLAALSRGLQRTSLPGKSWTVAASQPGRPPLRFKSKRGFIFIRQEEILWVAAAANYLEVHCISGMHRVRGTLAETCARLMENRQFLRIHRSILLNGDYLREVRSTGNGDWVVVLQDLRELPVSRKRALDEWISSKLSFSQIPANRERRLQEAGFGGSVEQRRPVELRPILQFSGLLRTS